MKSLVLAATLLLAGCVNVHVHFPPAPADTAAAGGDSAIKTTP